MEQAKVKTEEAKKKDVNYTDRTWKDKLHAAMIDSGIIDSDFEGQFVAVIAKEKDGEIRVTQYKCHPNFRS